MATDRYIPKTKPYSPHAVPGWVDYAKEKHDLARQAFVQWMYDGKPRCGQSYEYMYRTRIAFKHALRFCRRGEAQLKADACANSLKDADSRQFWKTVQKISCKKASMHVSKIANCYGSDDICNMWHDHFKTLYNSVPDTGESSTFNTACLPLLSQFSDISVTVHDVYNAIRCQKKAKSAGPNGLAMESFMFACPELWVHLSLLFTIGFKHCYLPDKFIESIVTPLVKNKGADLTDKNNYRAIAVSNADTKILERIILDNITTSDSMDKFQFGFKQGHSTTLCTCHRVGSLGFP